MPANDNMDVSRTGSSNSLFVGGDSTPMVAAAIAVLSLVVLVGFHFSFRTTVSA